MAYSDDIIAELSTAITAEGIFTPTITDNLTGDILKYIGESLVFDVYSRIEGGIYEGNYQMWNRKLGGWVPSCDVRDIVITERLE